ncbi:MAG: hypothetical protein JXB30_19900 [Anaerolineae bacterium]|nr:hypothetical protein [Anaerolineae bacterium]
MKDVKMKIWRPEIFQGNLRKKHYFEGWYFKFVDKTEKHAVAIIPGIALSPSHSHAFTQVLSSHHSTAHYFSFPIDAFTTAKNTFLINIADSSFSLDGLQLNVGSGPKKITANLSFSGIQGWPVRLFAPGAMGWYRFVPYLECYHGVLSFDHTIQGLLTLNGESIDMTGGRGYIEKDWGTSMPAAWIWMQTNHFDDKGVSLFGSVAKIPWLGSFFTGFIFGLYHQGRIYQFTTYSGARITRLHVTETLINLQLEDRLYTLAIEAKREIGVDLPAPRLGAMTSKVNESLRSEIGIQLGNKKTGASIYTGVGRNAGLEFVGNTAEMLAGLRQ